jgi:hypothetical protein
VGGQIALSTPYAAQQQILCVAAESMVSSPVDHYQYRERTINLPNLGTTIASLARRRRQWPAQSARFPRHVPLAGQQGHALPHPRHRRTVDHRNERFLRLHPHDQPGCDRPLPAHTGWCEGRGASVALKRPQFDPSHTDSDEPV